MIGMGILYFGCVVMLFVIARTQSVYSVRMWFLSYGAEDNQFAGLDLYKKLPSYEGMMFRPQFWFMWTHKSWKKWLAKKEQA